MQDAAAFWILTVVRIKKEEEKLILKLFSVSSCWGKLEEP